MFGIPSMADHYAQLEKLRLEDRIADRTERMFITRREVRENCLRMASAVVPDATADSLIAEAKKLEAYITATGDDSETDRPDDGA